MTRLAPRWSIVKRPIQPEESNLLSCGHDANDTAYQCTLQLPNSSPVKEAIVVRSFSLILVVVGVVETKRLGPLEKGFPNKRWRTESWGG